VEPPSHNLHAEHDVVIVGAGPVGLAMAIELSRLGLSTLVLDRRPPLDADARARPQLLVARTGDLAHLAQLGVDVRDPKLVSLLAIRTERDFASGTMVSGEVLGLPASFAEPRNIWELASQPPVALVPIAKLQHALYAKAIEAGAEVRYGCEVIKLRRHAREVSLVCADGSLARDCRARYVGARAAMAIIATGAARSLTKQTITESPTQRLIAGVFAVGGDRGRWVRVEIPLPGHARSARCTLLQTPSVAESGTAVLVDAQLDSDAPDERLHVCFDAVARELELDGAPYLFEPQVFTSAVTEVSRRFLGGDGRAPVVIAGDAAQTGHVFSGQTCFINVALALGLCDRLRRTRDARIAITEHQVQAPALAGALARYTTDSEIGAAVLAQASARHLTRHAPGAWALAGIARRQ
jgi:2-polyprenyl-6-methoxyphenol hydroxylase-like FAD-dependent oxidoreductase